MSATKGVFRTGPQKKNTKHPRMECCGSTHHSIHLSECSIRLQKPKTDPIQVQVREMKERGLTSEQVAEELNLELKEVNKMWV